MASSSAVIIHEIIDAIAAKQNLYRSAYAADLKRLEITHGYDAVVEALARLEASSASSAWDAGGHRARSTARSGDCCSVNERIRRASMIIPHETFNSINIYARVAGILVDRDDAAVARVKAVHKVDDLIAGLIDAADKYRALAVLCEQAHDLLTA